MDRREIDLSRVDFAYEPEDGGLSGAVTCRTLPVPDPGDYMILFDGERTSRYRVVSVDLRLEDPMSVEYAARVVFAPRRTRAVPKAPKRRSMIRQVKIEEHWESGWRRTLVSAIYDAGGILEIPSTMVIDPPEGVSVLRRDDERGVYVLGLDRLRDQISGRL